ncbi:hypothetical protein NGUA38_00165 [Salmonella enterica]|nr:hypothetical protein NGUA38_00165 [Salmonella enterica]
MTTPNDFITLCKEARIYVLVSFIFMLHRID